ncbi:MAG: heavy metal sensor histidine kinase [Pseudomonadota bacterium]
MRTASLSLRLALWVGALGTSLVCAVIGFSYLALVQQLDSQSREHLRGKLEQVQHVLIEEPSVRAIRADTHGLNDLLIGHDELHLAVSRPESDVALASFSVIARESLHRVRRGIGQDPYVDWRAGDGRRLLSLAAQGKVRNGETVAVVVTVDRRADDRLQAAFLRTSLLALPAALALVMAGAWWIARRGLKPLFRLRQAVTAVTTRDLSYRLTENGLPAELREVAASFNRMLQRLEDGVSRLFQFSGDLAHEMRTPISNLLGKTQVTLSKARPADEYRSVLESNAEELERLGRLVNDMLFLAQAEHAQAALQREAVDLKQDAARVAEFFEPVAEERQVTVRVDGAGVIQADRLMIRRAISNLVSNAIRHTPRGRSVTVRITETPDAGATVSVSNSGERISPEHLPRLFERFYRADPGRSRTQGGTGLGLAIVKSIMKLHGGNANAESGPGGITSFHLVFPNRAQYDQPRN